MFPAPNRHSHDHTKSGVIRQQIREAKTMEIFGPTRVGQVAFAANQRASLALPRNRFIQQIILRLRAVGDTDAGPVANEDNLASLVRNVTVRANGKDERVSAPLQDLHRYSEMRGGVGLTNSLITAASQSDVELGVTQAKIDFALNQDSRKNRNEINALLPAHMFSSLDLEVLWGDDDDIGASAADYVVDSAILEVAVKEVTLNDAEVAALKEAFFAYYLTAFEKTVDAAYTNFQFEQNLPVGKILRRAMLTVIDNGARINGDSYAATPQGLYEYRIRDKRRGNIDYIESRWEISQDQDTEEYGLAPDTGVTIVDFDALGSIDARGYNQGQIVVQANTEAPTGTSKTRLLVEEVSPI